MVFYLNGKIRHRIVTIYRHERERGYVGTSRNAYNVFQRNRWWGWETLEEEAVPAFAWIEQGAFGATSWESPLIARITAQLTSSEGV